MVEKVGNKPAPGGEPKTPKRILQQTSDLFNSLREKALNTYYYGKEGSQKRDQITRRKLRKAGALIVELPHRLERSVQSGQVFPEEAMIEIQRFAEDARDYLERDSAFGLAEGLLNTQKERGTLLSVTSLELLIYKLYPPK